MGVGCFSFVGAIIAWMDDGVDGFNGVLVGI